MRDIEHRLQKACIAWFSLQYPEQYRQKRLFAVPNGGHRNKATASKLKAEGVQPGVSDLIYLHETGVIFIEMKTAKGRQAQSQKAFQSSVNQLHYGQYHIARSLEEFIIIIRKVNQHTLCL